MKINELFKHRSVTSCMNDAYNLMTGNLKDLIKNTWGAIIPEAILIAFFVYLRTPNKMLHDWGEGNPITSFFLQSIVYVCLIVAAIVAGAILWRWITNKPIAHSLKRYTLVSICSYAFAIVIALAVVFGLIILGSALGVSIGEPAPGTSSAASPVHTAIMALCVLLFCIIALLLFMPLAYIVPRYMLLQKGEGLHLWKSYKMGFRHSGAIFKMGFLGGLLLIVCNIVLSIPMSIITGAQVFSQLGMLDGDPAGVPGYFTPLFLVVSTIIFFIYFYMTAWLLISYIYLYGSIESAEKEKAELAADKFILSSKDAIASDSISE